MAGNHQVNSRIFKRVNHLWPRSRRSTSPRPGPAADRLLKLPRSGSTPRPRRPRGAPPTGASREPVSKDLKNLCAQIRLLSGPKDTETTRSTLLGPWLNMDQKGEPTAHFRSIRLQEKTHNCELCQAEPKAYRDSKSKPWKPPIRQATMRILTLAVGQNGNKMEPW